MWDPGGGVRNSKEKGLEQPRWMFHPLTPKFELYYNRTTATLSNFVFYFKLPFLALTLFTFVYAFYLKNK